MLAVLGFSYINLNRIPQAIPSLQRAAKLLPNNYLVQSQLGYCLMTAGQTNAAIGYLRKGASLNSSYGPVWEHLGVAYQKRGRHRNAVDALEKQPGSCQHLDTPGNIWPKLIKRPVAALTRNALLLARNS